MSKQTQAVEQKSSKWPIVIFILIAIFLTSALFGLVVSLFSSGNSVDYNGNALIIPVSGVIGTEDESNFLSSTASSRQIVDRIRNAESDESIDAVIFEIDSPGGSPVASHEIVKAIKEMKKPNVAVIREVGASGAYWAASSTDYIFADELSITGSVGVLSSYLNFYKFFEQYNITYQRVVGGNYKDIGSPFKELTSQESIELDQKIALMHSYFLDDVSDSRNLTREQRTIISSGIFYLGLEARELNLIDDFGGEKEALEYLKQKIGKDMSAKRIKEKASFFDLLSSMSYNNGQSFARGFKDSLVSDNKISLT